MKVVITGGAGFLGKRLARTLLDKGEVVGLGGKPEEITELVLFDIVEAPGFENDARVRTIAGDISDRGEVLRLIGGDTASIFHFAAVVSSAAEADFDLGMRVNLHGTLNVLEAARALHHRPRFLFTSSIATYGGELPSVVTDATAQMPSTSYGAAKAAGELLIHDYSRKGFIDGRSLRLPTIMVRTGLPNKAASTWASSIIREPLSGVDAVCPVRPDTPMACLSPRKLVESFVHAHELPREAFGEPSSLLLTGIKVTAGEMAEAMERNKGNRNVGAITWEHDPAIQKICDGWPRETRSDRANALGFPTNANIDEIVRAFIEDDLDDQIRDYVS